MRVSECERKKKYVLHAFCKFLFLHGDDEFLKINFPPFILLHIPSTHKHLPACVK
jgi:hypothetical protein